MLKIRGNHRNPFYRLVFTCILFFFVDYSHSKTHGLVVSLLKYLCEAEACLSYGVDAKTDAQPECSDLLNQVKEYKSTLESWSGRKSRLRKEEESVLDDMSRLTAERIHPIINRYNTDLVWIYRSKEDAKRTTKPKVHEVVLRKTRRPGRRNARPNKKQFMGQTFFFLQHLPYSNNAAVLRSTSFAYVKAEKTEPGQGWHPKDQ